MFIFFNLLKYFVIKLYRTPIYIVKNKKKGQGVEVLNPPKQGGTLSPPFRGGGEVY